MTAPRVRDLFDRIGASARDRDRVTREAADDTDGAAELVAQRGPRVIALDSIHAVAPSDADKKRLARALRSAADSGAIVLVVAHEARAGNVAGTAEPEQRGDALIRVTPDVIEGIKCRWAEPTTIARKRPIV